MPRPSMGNALVTDLYQLTMAQGYFLTGHAEHESVFHLFFRRLPFKGGYAVACGLAEAVDYLDDLHFERDELDYLGSLVGGDGTPLFQKEFLAYLANMSLRLSVDALPEGTLVFAHEPLVRVCGPLLQAQLVETALLNAINFQTLVASKAARICFAAEGDPVLEFGLRRAQGKDGALGASRASYIGGCEATSNALAGMRFGIPVRGTHAHSWVMSFDSELQAFSAYAEAMPNNVVFLVDTYNTLNGVRNAIQVGQKMRARGHDMGGIRLDSGDLAYLSIEARKLLDQAGFTKAAIVASNDLDEYLIESLKQQGARIGVWGVGTKLVTAYDDPALGGVYKLSAIRPHGSTDLFSDRIKVSEQLGKISTPGIQQIRRYHDPRDGHFVADAICDEQAPPQGRVCVVDIHDPTRHKQLPAELAFDELLVPIFRDGKKVYDPPTATQARGRTLEQLARLSIYSRRLQNPHEYPVGLEQGLSDRRLALIRAAKNVEMA
jgi:nicotinate phosphoribosyltransferase